MTPLGTEPTRETTRADGTDRPEAPQGDETSTSLVGDWITELRELVHVEVALARDDVESELQKVKAAAILFSIAGGLAIAGLTLLLVALAQVISAGALSTFVIGILCAAIAGVAAAFGYVAIPKQPLKPTRENLARDVQIARDRARPNVLKHRRDARNRDKKRAPWTTTIHERIAHKARSL